MHMRRSGSRMAPICSQGSYILFAGGFHHPPALFELRVRRKDGATTAVIRHRFRWESREFLAEAMVWLFERGDEAIRLETRFDRDAGEYVLFVQKRDGSHVTERFKDAATFRARLEGLEQSLETTHWTRSGPFILPESWMRKPS